MIGAAIGTAVMTLVMFGLGSVGVGVPNIEQISQAVSARAPVAVSAPLSPATAPAADAADPELERMLDERLASLGAESLDPGAQAVLVETLFGDVLMAHNTTTPINPASVLKLAPTLMALERFGPDHHFRTAFLAGGRVENGILDGPLCVRTDGDPTFGRQQVAEAAGQLRAAGVREVRGDLVVSGPFSFQTTEETSDATARLRDALVRAGVRVDGETRTAGEVAGDEVAAVESERLLDIVQRQNYHSVNRLGDNLGTTVGGPEAVARYLVEKVGVPAGEVTVTHTSGLGHNALSARGVMLMLRALYDVTAREGLTLDHIIPLNGVDDSTMRARMVSGGLEGAVVAKTGTHYTQDGGIAALCGVAYTREKGPVFFVILNSQGPVHDFRKWEDTLVTDMVDAVGGPQPLPRAAEVASAEPSRQIQPARDPFVQPKSRQRPGRASRAD